MSVTDFSVGNQQKNASALPAIGYRPAINPQVVAQTYGSLATVRDAGRKTALADFIRRAAPAHRHFPETPLFVHWADSVITSPLVEGYRRAETTTQGSASL
jgi:hypothetical protein